MTNLAKRNRVNYELASSIATDKTLCSRVCAVVNHLDRMNRPGNTCQQTTREELVLALCKLFSAAGIDSSPDRKLELRNQWEPGDTPDVS